MQVGQKLNEQGFFNLSQGDSKIEIRPGGATKLELKYQIENENKHKFEIEVEWKTGVDGGTVGKVDIR